MTLMRTVVVLGAALVIMLTVVIVRAETTHLHYRAWQLDREARDLRIELRRKELELALRRNPALLLDPALGPAADDEAPSPENRAPRAR